MRVLLLTPIPHYLADTITAAGDKYEVSMELPNMGPQDADFVVSFGYRNIISEAYISYYRGRLINIHISMLPWNRGADPNFWSWFDRTPKGVSIHAIDTGIDTGDVLAQREISPAFKPQETLRSSHATAIHWASGLFADQWPYIRGFDWNPIRVAVGGSYHRLSDKDRWMAKLPRGWDTPVSDVEELGSASKDN